MTVTKSSVAEFCRRTTCRIGGVLFLVAVVAAPAHETDNFSLPLDRDLADLGGYLEAVHTKALEDTVTALNTAIEAALADGNETTRQRQLRRLHDPLTLVIEFGRQFSLPMFEDSGLERALDGTWARQSFAGSPTTHQDRGLNFSAYAPLDLRRWMLFSQSRTIKAYGVYFGTDKLVHFHHLGEDYYRMFQAGLAAGLDSDAAYRQVLQHYTEDGILSEQAIFGKISTGVYSNADLAVNHIGFRFYQNLTERVLLKGVVREPLVVRCGVFWRLNRQVRPRSGWWEAYVSDHWNEALNPSLYTPSMRSGIREGLEERAQEIVGFYTRVDGRPAEPSYFNDLARELSTYYGEPYGHSGSFDELLTIGTCCQAAFDKPAAQP